MKLVCTNLNRSFYADFTIDRSYFDTYAIYTDENSNPTQNSLTFSLFTKIFAMVLRKLSFDKSVKKLTLSFDDSEELQDFFLLRVECDHRIEKTFQLNLMDQKICISEKLYSKKQDPPVKFSGNMK